MITRWIRHPGFVFFLQAAALAAALAALGKFQPVRVGDTASYEQFPFSSPVEALRHPRTIGYPLFLEICGLFASSHGAVPVAGFAVHVLAVWVFWFGLRRVVGSDWTSMAVASSLLYSNTLFRYGDNLAADSLASSLAIATIGWLLVVVLGDVRRLSFGLLALGVLVTYQVRPAYLFLIPLLPVLGILLYWLATPQAATRRMRSMLVGLVAAVLLPYLAFCTVRWVVVDHFSLVSFGGNNFSAVVCMFLSADDVDALSPDVRPLAEAVMRRRQEVAASVPGYTAGATRRYMEIEEPFDINITRICVPAAMELHGEEWADVDRALWRLARRIVAEKPGHYAVWLAKAFVRGITMIVSEYVMNPVYFLLISCLAGAHAASVALRRRFAASGVDVDRGLFVELNSLWLIALGFSLANLLLVIVTTPPLGRFMDAAGVFLACVLARSLINRIELCRHVLRSRGACGRSNC